MNESLPKHAFAKEVNDDYFKDNNLNMVVRFLPYTGWNMYRKAFQISTGRYVNFWNI